MNKNFIKAGYERCTFENYVHAPYFRRSFVLDFVPDKSKISICGLGFYLLYINGQDITKGRLAPYISNPNHYCYYDTYDLTPYLKQGENVIGIMLGNGFYNSFGGFVWDFDKASWIGPPRVAVEFSAQKDNHIVSFCADEKFKTHPSPIYFDELRMGEYFDANNIIDNWNKPGFDDSDWNSSIPCSAPSGDLKLCEAQPIKIIRTIKPVSVKKHLDGYLYDFGENTSGVCTLTIKANKGQKITMWHGEILSDDIFDINNIIFKQPEFINYYKEYNQKDIYIARGEGIENYTPHFTYHGFRYVLVQGITEAQATTNLLTYNVMCSDITTIGNFRCSDNTANTLFEMVKRSDLSNFYYFPTDCPHREKNGWTGDASLSADHMALMYDVSASWREWLHNIRKSQYEEGYLPGIVPNDKWGYGNYCGPAWDSVLFNLPYMLYKYRGNIDIIKENASSMMRYLHFILSQKKDNGLVELGLGDWLPVGKRFDDYDAPLELTSSIMAMDIANKAAQMFHAAGLHTQSIFAKHIYTNFRSAIRTELISPGLEVIGQCQSSQALALYYGVFDEDEKLTAFSHLIRYVHENNDNFNCGILGMHVLFHVLSEFGEGEIAYKMITKKDFPSYGYLIEIGDTTLSENFSQGGSKSSHNHHFFGDIGRWFITKVAGLNIIDNKNIEICPDFISTLDYACAEYILPSGKASVHWKKENDLIRLTVLIPQEVDCTFNIPENINIIIDKQRSDLL